MAWSFIVEDGTGLPDSNSYVTLEYYVDFCESRGYPIAYTTAEEIEAVHNTLIKATEMVDMNWNYEGTPTVITQALEFPRTIDEVDIGLPVSVVKATCTAAVTEPESGNFFGETEANVTSKSEKVGPIEVATKYTSSSSASSGDSNLMYPNVYAYLKPYVVPASVGPVLGMCRVISG
jgi:hypothetical protein